MLGSISAKAKSSVKAFLPRGGSLPYDQWLRRHRVIVWLLWAHAVGLTAFGLLRGYTIWHTTADTVVIAAAAYLASQKALGRKWQSTVAAFGLVAASGIFVHLSGGVVEVHFHYFVMVAVLSL